MQARVSPTTRSIRTETGIRKSAKQSRNHGPRPSSLRSSPLSALHPFRSVATGASANASPPVMRPFATLTARGLTKSSKFGAAVALSQNGSTAIAGARGMGSGKVFVFVRRNGKWRSSHSPTAVVSEPNPRPGDEFGSSVAISADGSIALVAAFMALKVLRRLYSDGHDRAGRARSVPSRCSRAPSCRQDPALVAR